MDRFTTDVIQASLLAIAEEMFAVLKRTAMSPIIYEVLDAGVAVTDSEGRLACTGAGIPSFVGVLPIGGSCEQDTASTTMSPRISAFTVDKIYILYTHVK